jgi:hypothetical protein
MIYTRDKLLLPGSLAVSKTEDSTWKVALWRMQLGPALLILTLSLYLIKTSLFFLNIPLLCLLGLWFSYKWRWVGIGGLAALIILSKLYHPNIIPSDSITWEWLFVLSVLLGISINHLAREGVEDDIRETTAELHQQKAAAIILNEQLHKEMEELKLRCSHAEQAEVKMLETTAELNQQKAAAISLNEQLHKEMEALKLRCTHAEQAEVKMQEKKAELHQQKTAAISLNEQLHKEIEELKLRCSHAEQAEVKMLEKTAELHQQNAAAISLNEQLHIEMEELKLRCRRKEEELIHTASELKQRKVHIDGLSQQLKESHNSIDSLQQNELTARSSLREKELALETVTEANKQLQLQLQNSSLSCNADLNDNHIWQEMRKAQGLYFQLREQFEQKSLMLNQTRREMFFIQEEVQNLQKEKTEIQLYQYSEQEKALIEHILKMEQSHKNNVKYLEVEIDMYLDFVKCLMAARPQAFL